MDIDSDQVDQWVENLRKVGIDEDVLTLTYVIPSVAIISDFKMLLFSFVNNLIRFGWF